MNNDFTYLIPSESNIKNIVGSEIKDIIKCSFETYEEFIEYLNTCGVNGHNDKKSYFKYSYGTLLIIFKNCELSFSSAEDLNSIILCYEKNTESILNKRNLLEDVDVLNKISIFELDINSDIINQRIDSIDVLTRKDLSPKEKGLPSEVGLRFNLNNKKNFILSHNLTQNNFVFSILFENERLPHDIITKLSYSI